MWGSEFHFDGNGEAVFVQQTITFPEKVRYLLALPKGLGFGGANEPEDAYDEIDPEKMHIPSSQIIYVGDGGSDMPMFALMSEKGGIAIGVYDAERAEEWQGHQWMRADRLVQNLARADYSEGSELMQSIRFAVESVCKLIQLRKLGDGE